jgi:hypothetical protein
MHTIEKIQEDLRMSVPLSSDTTRVMRHMVAAIAFRASRSLRDAPPGYENTRLSDDSMSAKELILHMTNVTGFAIATVTNTERIRHEPRDWKGEVHRFYALLGELDAALTRGASLDAGMDLKLVQGPLADALTHVGQLHSMRRKMGTPIAPVNYIKADIQTGRTALADQPA